MPEVQALLDQAYAVLNAKNVNEGQRRNDARKLLQSAVEIAHAKADKQGEAIALSDLATLSGTSQFSGTRDRFAGPVQPPPNPSSAHVADALPARLPAVQALVDQAYSELDANRTSEADNLVRKALLAAETAADKQGMANALVGIGHVNARIGKQADSLSAFQQALDLYRATGDKLGEALALNDIGVIYSNSGRPLAALSIFQQVLPLYQAAGNKTGEALELNNIGAVNFIVGRPAESRSSYQRALAIDSAPNDTAFSLNRLGEIDWKTGNPNGALALFLKALPLYRLAGDKNGEAATLNSIGIIYSIHDYGTTDPMPYFSQALSLYREAGNKPGEATVLNSVGDWSMNSRHSGDALAAFQKEIKLYRSSGEQNGQALALTGIGSLYADAGRPDEAISAFQKALALYQATGYVSGEAQAFYEVAKEERNAGRWLEADADYTSAIALVEQVRRAIGRNATTKQSYLAKVRDYYCEYLDFLLSPTKENGKRMDGPAAAAPTDSPAQLPPSLFSSAFDAFNVAEQTKARSLLDLLDEGHVNLERDLSEDEREDVRALRAESDKITTQLIHEGVENKPGAKARFSALQQQQREAENRLESLSESLYALHPHLAESRGANPVNGSDIIGLLGEDAALLEFVQTTGNRIALFILTAEKPKPGENALSAYVSIVYLTLPKSFASGCLAFEAACADPRKDPQAPGSALYKALLKSAIDGGALAGKTRLIICPDGPLWNVPFQALPTDGGKPFLGLQFEINYAYSASAAVAARKTKSRHGEDPLLQRTRALPSQEPSEDALLVVANPSFGDAKRFGDLDESAGLRPLDSPSRPLEAPSRPIEAPSRMMGESLTRGGHIMPLPGTQREADALRKLYPDATILTGIAAQETTVKRDAGKYRYMHFATHGFFNDAAPMLSSLVLAQLDAAGKAAGDDGFLTAREIFDLHLPNTEMVTLSACNTGRGAIQSGEGVVGLTWALFAAGCPTQVVSQWSVDDACTATLMTKFYTEIKAGKPKGVALRDAAHSIAGDGVAAHRHPYYWAPFVLFGDWN